MQLGCDSDRFRIFPVLLLAACTILLPPALSAQVLMMGASGTVHLHMADRAVFEAAVDRDDLPCSVSPNKAVLGFDLRFHASYEIGVPLSSLAGNENLLTIVLRVVTRDRPDEPTYLMQRVRVPSIEEDAKGDAYLHGGFDIGEGEYDVGLLMRDRSERVCSHFWDVESHLDGRDKDIELVLGPGQIAESEVEQFRDEPPVVRAGDRKLLNVKVLVNFAPQNARAATLQPYDTSALVSILRTISRDPRIGKFSVVAFNMQEQRVLSRQDGVDRIDFHALGESLDTLNLGTIDLTRLTEKHGETRFLTRLMLDELSTAKDADALIFAGPKALLEENIPREDLAELGAIDFPIFYMNYNLFPQRSPWRDAISHAVRFLNGTEYTITRPPDLWFSVREMVSQIVEMKQIREVSRNGLE